MKRIDRRVRRAVGSFVLAGIACCWVTPRAGLAEDGGQVLAHAAPYSVHNYDREPYLLESGPHLFVDYRYIQPGRTDYFFPDGKEALRYGGDPATLESIVGKSKQAPTGIRIEAQPAQRVGPVVIGGKLVRADGVAVVHDRLGSVVARSSCGDCSSITTKEYFPYGDEVGTSTSGNVDKFGTYHRDATTGLDYADQRYFAGTMGGRFLTADPLAASASVSDPASWNRYNYTNVDPINSIDPNGEVSISVDSEGRWWLEDFSWGRLPVVGGDPTGMNIPPLDMNVVSELSRYFRVQPFFDAQSQAWRADLEMSDEAFEAVQASGFASAASGTATWGTIVIGAGATGVGWTVTVVAAGAVVLGAELYAAKKLGEWIGGMIVGLPTIDFLELNCKPGKLAVEPATGKSYKGGTSYEQEYDCTGITFYIHWIERDGRIIHGPHVRGYDKA